MASKNEDAGSDASAETKEAQSAGMTSYIVRPQCDGKTVKSTDFFVHSAPSNTLIALVEYSTQSLASVQLVLELHSPSWTCYLASS